MSTALFIAGVLIIAIGIVLSIALHEVGHLVPAKLFKVRVTQYMVGFGPTMFSRRRGETEYGVKAIPLGGYVAMIGMYPPPDPEQTAASTDDADTEDDDVVDQDPYLQQLGAEYAAPLIERSSAAERVPDEKKVVHSHSTGLFQQMSAEAREVAAEELRPGDENRMFYRLATWKKVMVMLGGPAMNGLIALALTAGIVSFHGQETPTTQIAEVQECVITAQTAQEAAEAEQATECDPSDPPTPAAEAGLLPGDTITSFGGEQVNEWNELFTAIRAAAGEERELIYQRDGETFTTSLTPIEQERPVTDNLGRVQRDGSGAMITDAVGFIGVAPTQELQEQSPLEAFPIVGNQIQAVAEVVLTLPVRLYDVAVSTFTQAERDPDGPISVVGVGRIAGELSAQEQIPLESRFATLMSLVAGVNVALMVFNLLPLLPLDGGHVAGALYESLRRRWAKLRGKPDPGPFDISKLLPLTYVVAFMLLAMGVLLIFADIVNPIRLFE